MSTRSRRELVRFDYKKFHSTGVKSPVKICLENSPIMAGNPGLEKKIFAKIIQFQKENDPDLLYDVTEIEDAVSEFRRMIDSFIDVHVALKDQLEDYDVVYPDYQTKLDDMTEWVKKSRTTIKTMKKEAEEKVNNVSSETRKALENERIASLKSDLTADEKVWRTKINRDILTYDEENSYFVEKTEGHLESKTKCNLSFRFEPH